MYCSNKSFYRRYYFMWWPFCIECFNKCEKYEEEIECVIKHYFYDIIYILKSNSSKIPNIVYFHIGKYVKERNRKHKFERKCYHFHKATCKTIYAFCLFAKRYYPLELNRDVRLKICKFILE